MTAPSSTLQIAKTQKEPVLSNIKTEANRCRERERTFGEINGVAEFWELEADGGDCGGGGGGGDAILLLLFRN